MPRVLLRGDEGYLVAGAAGTVSFADRTGDSGIWCWEGPGRLVNALEADTVLEGDCAVLQGGDFEEPTPIDLACGAFTAEPAPDKLPSECLRSLRDQGYCQFAGILSPHAIEQMRALVHETLDQGDANPRPSATSSLKYLDQSALFYRMHFHPVVMWVLEQFFGTPWLRAAHPPVPRVAAAGSGPGQWHNDM